MAHSEARPRRRSQVKRPVQFVLRLTEAELAELVNLSESNFRRPGDQLRCMIAEELAKLASAKGE